MSDQAITTKMGIRGMDGQVAREIKSRLVCREGWEEWRSTGADRGQSTSVEGRTFHPTIRSDIPGRRRAWGEPVCTRAGPFCSTTTTTMASMVVSMHRAANVRQARALVLAARFSTGPSLAFFHSPILVVLMSSPARVVRAQASQPSKAAEAYPYKPGGRASPIPLSLCLTDPAL